MAEKPHSSSSIMFVVIAVAVLLVVLLVPLSMLGKGAAPTAVDDDVDQRIQPVARFELQKAAAGGGDGQPRDGATVYAKVCQACHATGVAGAPKAGDKGAWAPRIAKGSAELLKSVLNGKGAMPPKGGGADLSEDEVAAAVEHLLGLSK
ncbi:MAG: cytochrome c5 family protein [Rhodocyclaceae bacterium]|nr:cytochrome c5 family protein [Rhodocyclaceae bacterium]